MKNAILDYDIIVIGAGNAGLSAAVTASRQHKKVLLLEKNILPGGTSSSFVRGRFEFEPSLHELGYVGTETNPSKIRKFCNKNNLSINFVEEHCAFRAITLGENGYDVKFPAGTTNFIQKMEDEVPGSLEPMKKLWKKIEKIQKAVAYFDTGKQNALVVVLKYREFMRAASHSLKEVMDDCKLPIKAQAILTSYWPYLGSSIDSIDFMHYALMLDGYMSVEPSMPAYRSHEISCALEKAIRQNGGEIWYNAQVTSLLYENRKVTGVKIGDKEIKSKKVLCTIYPELVFHKMLPKHIIPEKAIQLSNARTNGCVFFSIYLGLNKTKEELGIKDYTTIIYNSSDPIEQFQSMKDLKKAPLFVNCLNCAIENASTEGTSMLFITALYHSSIDLGVSKENYYEWKQELASYYIKRYEETLHISIQDFIEEIEICTPSTFARYNGAPNGTPYGYEVSLWDSLVARSNNALREMFIQNLIFIGAHSDNGDGYSSTYVNGELKANIAIKQINRNKKEYKK